ncbi:molybdopterin synthase catalytic subunit-like [Mercurialis annua]|uniref:molybdopterin synthase catalytic subunit-like n=1 Tax=Mercurialis annua TaxID=3986 RepID=UPI00215EEAD5|nr:molybdopterin synthase catalytic subunit-like [Mercurialis annua]
MSNEDKTLVEISEENNRVDLANEDKTLVEILEENNPIDLAKYISYVSAPQAGGIATFSGTTRDTFEDKSVVELRYEAYVPMAIRELKSICASARTSWDIHSIAVAHRLGSVPVGETSVFVAVSAVHRGDALDACKFIIDDLKASVPIWKKEVYANGEVWKENSEFMERKPEIGKSASYGVHGKKSCCGTKVKVNEESPDISNQDSGIRVKVSEAGRKISSTHDGIRMSGGGRKTSAQNGGVTIKVSEVS